MNAPEMMLGGFIGSIGDSDLKFLESKLYTGLGSDKADVANFISKNEKIDEWLASAAGPDEWFEMIDLVKKIVQHEAIRRSR